MAEIFNFRSAFNGFHREDVVHYIEYLNTRHSAEINQLNTELEQLRNQNTVSDEAAELRAQLAEAQEINDRLQAQIAELEDRCTAPDQAVNSDLERRCKELEQQLAEARSAAAFSSQHSLTLELETYRRAERTEREARERAELVYRQANGALADATVKVDEAYAQLDDLTQKVNTQLIQLQQAVTASRQVLSDASHSLYTINTNDTI